MMKTGFKSEAHSVELFITLTKIRCRWFSAHSTESSILQGNYPCAVPEKLGSSSRSVVPTP
jgi:hypothetical protein